MKKGKVSTKQDNKDIVPNKLKKGGKSVSVLVVVGLPKTA